MECLEEGAVESMIEDRVILAGGWIYGRAVVLDGLRAGWDFGKWVGNSSSL